MDEIIESIFSGLNNRALQIILPDQKGQTQDSLFNDDMAYTAQYYLSKNYDQEVIQISTKEYKEMLKGKLNLKLKEKIDWAKKADEKFEIRLNQHSSYEKEGQPNSPIDVGKILINQGLNQSDFKEKCTIHWDACFTGRDNPLNNEKAVIKQLANYMSNEGVGGIHFKGSKFATGVNRGDNKKMLDEPIGISVIFTGSNRCAKMDEKNEKGKYKYMIHLTTPPSTKISKIIKGQTGSPSTSMNYSLPRQNNSSSSQNRTRVREPKSSHALRTEIKSKKKKGKRLM